MILANILLSLSKMSALNRFINLIKNSLGWEAFFNETNVHLQLPKVDTLLLKEGQVTNKAIHHLASLYSEN